MVRLGKRRKVFEEEGIRNMRVRVLDDVCQGHTRCQVHAPSIFELAEEDGRAHVAGNVVPGELEEQVRLAARSCPERAIEIIED